jgi:hypothetical protein
LTSAAVFDVTAASYFPANCSVSPTLLGTARLAGSAATAGEEQKTFNYTRREHDVNTLLARGGLPAWERAFKSRPLALDVY